MRAKKAKSRSGAVEYRLRADRKLRKLSLRKLSDRKSKPARTRRTSRTRRPVAATQLAPASEPSSPGSRLFGAHVWHTPAVAFTAVAAVMAAMLLMGRPRTEVRRFADATTAAVAAPPAEPAETSRDHSHSPMTEAGTRLRLASSDAGMLPAIPDPRTTVTKRTESSGSGRTAADTRPAGSTPTAASAKPAAQEKATAHVSVADERASADSTARLIAAEPMPEAEANHQEAVTITGCLESANGAFRLKDTSGANVPKARGWRTGFMKKRPAPVELVDRTNRLSLTNYLGQRIAATGILSDREMELRSVKRVSASCGS